MLYFEMKDKDSILAIVLLGLICYLLFHKPLFIWIDVFIILASLISSSFSLYLHMFWSRLTAILGKTNSTIILILFFYFIIFPLSLIKKLFSFRKKEVNRNQSNSTFIIRERSYIRKDLENLW
jgi:hypothetical protein